MDWLQVNSWLEKKKTNKKSFVLKNISETFSWLVGFMVFNTTFNNISVISWRSVFMVEETGGLRENHLPSATETFKTDLIT